jgi:hypothetical protein
MRGGEWDRARRVEKGAGVGRGVGRRRAAFYPDRRFYIRPAVFTLAGG